MTKHEVEKAAKLRLKRERERKRAIREIAAYMTMNALQTRVTRSVERETLRIVRSY